MRDLIALPVALLAGAFGAWLVGRPAAPVGETVAPSATPREAPTRAPRVDPLHDAVDDLNLRQDALEDLVDELASATPLPEPPAPDPEAAAAQEAALTDALRRRAATQPRDPAWSPRAEDTVRAWAQDQPDVALEELDCGGEVCRFVVRYPDALTQSSGLAALPLSGPWRGEGFTRAVDGDPLASEVYLAREGASLLP